MLKCQKGLECPRLLLILGRKKYPEFLKSLKAGKEEADERVEKALFQLATGYEYDAEKPVTVGEGKGFSRIEIAKYREKTPSKSDRLYFLAQEPPERQVARQTGD